MSISNTKRRRLLAAVAVIVVMLTIGNAVATQSTVIVSKGFEMCIKGIAGLTSAPKAGIDAVEGNIKVKKATIDFMVSRHPNLPALMNIHADKSSVIGRQLSDDMTLIAESVGPQSVGTERLYAFNKGDVTTPMGPIQDQIFVQLWSDEQPQNIGLVKRVGDALTRCH